VKPQTGTKSLWTLRLDLLSAKALVWIASMGREADLTPEAHLYLFDLYCRLAELHRTRGRTAKAMRLQAKAEAHYRAGGGGEGPPYAAAMAMPRPRPYSVTDAVSKHHLGGPDDAA